MEPYALAYRNLNLDLSDITFSINFRKVWDLERVQWKRREQIQSHSNKMCQVLQIIVSFHFHLMFNQIKLYCYLVVHTTVVQTKMRERFLKSIKINLI